MKEQYTHILRVIEQTGPVESPEEGIAMVSANVIIIITSWHKVFTNLHPDEISGKFSFCI